MEQEIQVQPIQGCFSDYYLKNDDLPSDLSKKAIMLVVLLAEAFTLKKSLEGLMSKEEMGEKLLKEGIWEGLKNASSFEDFQKLVANLKKACGGRSISSDLQELAQWFQDQLPVTDDDKLYLQKEKNCLSTLQTREKTLTAGINKELMYNEVQTSAIKQECRSAKSLSKDLTSLAKV